MLRSSPKNHMPGWSGEDDGPVNGGTPDSSSATRGVIPAGELPGHGHPRQRPQMIVSGACLAQVIAERRVARVRMLGAAAPAALVIAKASAATRSRVSTRRRFSSPPGGLNHRGGCPRRRLPLAAHARFR